jgi:cell division protein FtsZ
VRSRQAEGGIDELHRVVDTLITIPNNRLLALAGRDTAMKDAFALADDVLLNAVRGISDLITTHGLINLDFADVRTIMNEMGMALMGTGMGSGEERAVEAARAAISSPLLEDLSIEGARGVLINVTGSEDMTLFEVNEASTLVQDAAHEDANIIFGAVVDEQMPKGELRVTVIATGLEDDHVGRGRDRRETETLSAVRPLRPEPAPLDGGLSAEDRAAPARSESREPAAPRRPSSERGEDWVSPFEDELEIPTFLRKQAD